MSLPARKVNKTGLDGTVLQRKGLYGLTPSGPAFSITCQAWGSEAHADAKNQGCHLPIEIKFCTCHYSHKSMPDANIESSSFFVLALGRGGGLLPIINKGVPLSRTKKCGN